LKIFLSRWLCTDVSENIERLKKEASEAHKLKADIVVFPEIFLTGYRGQCDPKAAREAFSGLSKKYAKSVFLFGTISEKRKNRATMWLAGKEILSYDKVHLFKPNNEHKMWEEGKGYKAAQTPFGKIGVIVCNDIRFPEAARTLKMKDKIDLLLVPAYWPWRRNGIWKTMLRARAIENAICVAGCCIAHVESKDERFFGAGNYVFDPLGKKIEAEDDRIYEVEIPFKGKVVVDPLEYR